MHWAYVNFKVRFRDMASVSVRVRFKVNQSLG